MRNECGVASVLDALPRMLSAIRDLLVEVHLVRTDHDVERGTLGQLLVHVDEQRISSTFRAAAAVLHSGRLDQRFRAGDLPQPFLPSFLMPDNRLHNRLRVDRGSVDVEHGLPADAALQQGFERSGSLAP